MENIAEPIEEGPSVSAQDISVIAERQRCYFLGRGHKEAGRLELAIAVFSEYADALDEADKVYPWMWIAELQLQLGATELAVKSYRRALSFSASKLQQSQLKRIIKELLPKTATQPRSEPHRKYTKPAEMDKAIHTLRGIVEGMILDGTVNANETNELYQWANAHDHLANKEPFGEILGMIDLAISDGELTVPELEEIASVCQSFGEAGGNYYDLVTASLQQLQGLCHGILADGEINDEELAGLRRWLDSHTELRRFYPFDEVETIIEAILSGGTFGNDESLMLKALFLQYADIREESVRSLLVSEVGDTYNLKGFCALSPDIHFEDKRFCFTGESPLATRPQLHDAILRLGGKPERNVVQGLDYLIVGSSGSSCWAFSCYGRKVEKAIELRRNGGPVVIVQERDFWRAAGAKS